VEPAVHGAFRLLQGVFGAAIVPLSQTFLLDINPREKAGQAMAMWGAGIMVGPIIGPTLGGWLTESYNWRWVFLINLPVGAAALLGCLAFLPRMPRKRRSFDMTGFALLSLALGSLQLMLDRGGEVDWFASPEIWLYLLCQFRASGCSRCISCSRSTLSLTPRCFATGTSASG
jgi:DHA2 family multidrug resistance protein